MKFEFTDQLRKLFSIFLKNGDELMLVGGAVRNFLLQKPIADYDLSTKYNPDETIELLKKNNIKYLDIGKKFGTITAIIDKIPFEITTIRKDFEQNGRHTKVIWAKSYEEDAARRDFTMNALYMDYEGEIYDYYDGISDLNKGIVRFIGNAEDRIKEDYLRIIRFFRFYCSYGYVLDYRGLIACQKNAEGLEKLSYERISQEMTKILKSNYPIKALQEMERRDILKNIALQIDDFGILQYFYSLKNNINDLTSWLFPLLISSNKSSLLNLSCKWKISKKYKQEIEFFFKHSRKTILSKDDIKSLIFTCKSKEYIKDIVIYSYLYNINLINTPLKYINEDISFINAWNIPQLPISGNDIFWKKGKETGELLILANKIFIASNYSKSKEEIMRDLKGC